MRSGLCPAGSTLPHPEMSVPPVLLATLSSFHPGATGWQPAVHSAVGEVAPGTGQGSVGPAPQLRCCLGGGRMDSSAGVNVKISGNQKGGEEAGAV